MKPNPLEKEAARIERRLSKWREQLKTPTAKASKLSMLIADGMAKLSEIRVLLLVNKP